MRNTPKSSNKAMLKGTAALGKFLGINNVKNMSIEDKDNYNGWISWMKEQVCRKDIAMIASNSFAGAVPAAPTPRSPPFHSLSYRTIPMS